MNLIPKENNPCYGCSDRKAMCRIGCKRYEEFSNDLKGKREKWEAKNREKNEWIIYNKEKSERLKARKGAKH